MALKKCIAVRLEVIYDFHPNNRKLGGLPVRIPTPSDGLLLVAWGRLPAGRITQKCHQKQVDALFFIEKLPTTTFF
jgi:hypothetical protein